MLTVMTVNRFRNVAIAATLGLAISAGSCGELADATDPMNPGAAPEDPSPELAAAGQTITISCPQVVTATWAQAAYGRTNSIRQKTNLIVTRAPTTLLMCTYFSATAPPPVRQFVQLEPQTLEFACNAKVTFTGQGSSVGAVPPFGGFIFRSKRIQATSDYDFSSGRCHLSVPAPVYPTAALTIEMSKPCTTNNDGTYTCPANAQIVDTGVI